MKKLFALLFVAAAFTFTSCGDASGNASEEAATEEGMDDAAEEEAPAEEAAVEEAPAATEDAAAEEDVNPEPRKATRKRKRLVEKSSPVDAIAGQAEPVGPGLGQAKHPKKKPRTHENTRTDVQKPLRVQCKKKKGACKYEIVFGNHYNKNMWDQY